MRDEVIVNTDDKIFASALVKKLKEKEASSECVVA